LLDATPFVASIPKIRFAKRHPDRNAVARSVGGFALLMIMCIKENDTTRALKLEGKLQGPWVQDFK